MKKLLILLFIVFNSLTFSENQIDSKLINFSETNKFNNNSWKEEYNQFYNFKTHPKNLKAKVYGFIKKANVFTNKKLVYFAIGLNQYKRVTLFLLNKNNKIIDQKKIYFEEKNDEWKTFFNIKDNLLTVSNNIPSKGILENNQYKITKKGFKFIKSFKSKPELN